MKFSSITVAAAALSIFGATVCGAQTPSPPASTTNPSSASSPSQREATRSPANESPATTASKPSDASTPHQTTTTGSKHHQTMKECMDAQSASNSGMAKSDMTKACEQQMKMQKEHTPASTMPKSNDGSQTSAPK